MPEHREGFQEVLNLGEGVYRVKYHRLNSRSLKNLRSRLTGEVFKIRREMGHLYDKIDAKRELLKEKEAMLNNLTEERIQSYLDAERKREGVIMEKANAFLRDYIGVEAYDSLQENGAFEFIGLDGKEYRIKKDGTLQQECGKYWSNMCVLKPRDLPLPDIIASVFTAVSKVKDGLRGSQVTGREVKA